jgi:hypothetical protein
LERLITRKIGNTIFRAQKKDYFYHFKLKAGLKEKKLFRKEDKEAIHNITNDKNVFDSNLGGEIIGLTFSIVAPNYEPIVLTPSQDQILKDIGKITNASRIIMATNTKPLVDLMVKRFLPPMPIIFKGEPGSTNPLNVSNVEHMPIASTPKLPLLTISDKPYYMKTATPLEAIIKFDNADFSSALNDYIFCVEVPCYEFIEQVVTKDQSA